MTGYLNLDNLLLDISSVSDVDLDDFARKNYFEMFVKSGACGTLKCHDNQDVLFWKNQFDHAFYTPKKWEETTIKQIVDKRRVQRMTWIQPLIKGEVPNSQCWHIQQNLLKRMYCVASKGYMLWLEPNGEDCWRFSTAYTAETSYIYKQTRGGKMIWKK